MAHLLLASAARLDAGCWGLFRRQAFALATVAASTWLDMLATKIEPCGCSLFVLYWRMAFTKGEILRHCIAFALRSVRLSSRRLGLTEDDRMRVADDTLRELRRHGAWKDLDDVIEGGPSRAPSSRSDDEPNCSGIQEVQAAGAIVRPHFPQK
jgi:hypothetical protein